VFQGNSLIERREHLIQRRDYFGDFRAENGSVISLGSGSQSGHCSPPEMFSEFQDVFTVAVWPGNSQGTLSQTRWSAP
jgi:hypothetical protein